LQKVYKPFAMGSAGSRNVRERDAATAKRPLNWIAADFLNEDDAPIGRALGEALELHMTEVHLGTGLFLSAMRLDGGG